MLTEGFNFWLFAFALLTIKVLRIVIMREKERLHITKEIKNNFG